MVTSAFPESLHSQVDTIRAALGVGTEAAAALPYLSGALDISMAQTFFQQGTALETVSLANAGLQDLDLDFPRRILDNMAATEALLQEGRLAQTAARAMMGSTQSFESFSQSIVTAALGANCAFRENNLLLVDAAADLLPRINSGIEFAGLARPKTFRFPAKLRTNVFDELGEEMESVDLHDPELDVLEFVEDSRPGTAPRLGSEILELVFTIAHNEALTPVERSIFRVTNRVYWVGAVVPYVVAVDRDSFGKILDALYVLLYEGAGGSKNQLALAHGDENCAALWRMKHLRTELRHDVDHGKQVDIDKARQKIGNAFEELIGCPYPRTKADWGDAQIQLYRDLLAMLKDFWLDVN